MQIQVGRGHWWCKGSQWRDCFPPRPVGTVWQLFCPIVNLTEKPGIKVDIILERSPVLCRLCMMRISEGRQRNHTSVGASVQFEIVGRPSAQLPKGVETRRGAPRRRRERAKGATKAVCVRNDCASNHQVERAQQAVKLRVITQHCSGSSSTYRYRDTDEPSHWHHLAGTWSRQTAGCRRGDGYDCGAQGGLPGRAGRARGGCAARGRVLRCAGGCRGGPAAD